MDSTDSKRQVLENGAWKPFQSKGQQVRLQPPLVESSTQTDGTSQLTSTAIPSPLVSHHHESASGDKTPLVSFAPQLVAEPPPPYQSTKTELPTPLVPDHTYDWESYTIVDSLGLTTAEMKQAKKNADSGPQSFLSSLKSNLSCYVLALRPWSFPASITPVALGSCLAYKTQGVFDINIFLTTIFTALCVHAAGNLVNTYFDFVRGVDTKKSDDRTLVDSILEPSNVANFGVILYISGCVGFALLSVLSPAKMEHLALIYFCGLSSSFLYTGGLGLKYIAMGDILIVLTFGPLSVVFSHLCQTGQLSLIPLVYALPLALNTEAILHCNNTRDMEGDRQAGAMTLAILLGHTGSYCLFCCLLFTPYFMFLVTGLNYSRWLLLPMASIFLAFNLEKQFRRRCLDVLPQQVAQLNLLMGVLYILSLSLADSLPSMTQLS